MPRKHHTCPDPPGREELDELVDGVEVVLGLDVVFLVICGFGGRGFVGKAELRGEGHGRAVEGDEPDGEDLGDVYVEG